MPEIRGGGEKWKQRAAGAKADYLKGVQRPRRRWSEATVEAAEAYAAGVQEALSAGRFERGVANAGEQSYQQGVTTKGPTRYVEGVQRSGDAYDRGFRPYAETIRSVDLPKRGRRGDPANLDRARIIAEALHNKRKEILGG